MKNVLVLVVFLVSIVIELSGCREPADPLTAQERLNNSADAFITKAVMDSITEERYKIDYRSNIILIKQYISEELGSISSSLKEVILSYGSLYDASTDKIARTYIAMAKERGHLVKTYKPSMNLKIIKVVPITLDINNKSSYTNLDKALVEYDKNNRIKSVLIRVHTISKYVGWMHYRYSIVMYGDLARIIESKIENNSLNLPIQSHH